MIPLLPAEQVGVFLTRVLCVSYLPYDKEFLFLCLCYLDSMVRVQSVDDKTVFVFVGDANAHHSEWLESVSITDRHGRDALDFCSLSGFDQWCAVCAVVQCQKCCLSNASYQLGQQSGALHGAPF